MLYCDKGFLGFCGSTVINWHFDAFLPLQGEEICVALQTHINDVMLRRYSKARSAANAPVNGDVSNNVKSPIVNANEKHIEELSKALEESQRNAKQVSNLVIEV